MPVSKQYTVKNGMASLERTAKAMCRAVTFAAPAIRAQYPSNTTLMAALTAAEAVCSQLIPALDEQIVADQFDALPISDYADEGVRPGRLP